MAVPSPREEVRGADTRLARAKPLRPRARNHALRLVLVEDYEDAAEILAELLSMCGHEVRLAKLGGHALEMLRSEGADLVLCDLGLPDMSGLELARAIRDDAGLRRLPMVAVSGHGAPDDLQRSLDAGFDAHVVKPLDCNALNAVIERLASSRQG
jgi:CheY-like chemotaxis protein